MNVQLVIYLASVADGVKITLGCHVFAFGCAAIAFLMAADITPSGEIAKKRKKISAICVTLGALSSIPLVLIPTGEDIYKIAGVTEQQKAAIDAAGRIVK